MLLTGTNFCVLLRSYSHVAQFDNKRKVLSFACRVNIPPIVFLKGFRINMKKWVDQGTVARDFFCLGLFHDRLYVGPRFEAKIISNLAKLLVFFYESS